MSATKPKMSPEYVKRVIAEVLRVNTGLRAGEGMPHLPPVALLYGVYHDHSGTR